MTGQRLKGVISTLALLGVVAGVPWFLYALGGGLPTTAPSVHQVGSFLGRPITDTDLVRGANYVCWAVWLLFLAALAAEAAAWTRAGPGPAATHRGFRIPGLQGVAGSMFLTAILLLPQRPAVGANPSFAGASPPTARNAVVTGPPVMGDGGAVRPGIAARLGSARDSRVPYTVERYDTPWGIAEQCLGNGLRWREITDADGNTLATGVDDWVQINGRLIDEPQARLIYPGQTLYLPAPAMASSQLPIHPSAVRAHSEDAPVKDPHASPIHDLPRGNPDPRPPAAEPDPPTPSITAEPSEPTPGIVSLVQRAVPTNHHDDLLETVGLLGAGIVAGAALTIITRTRLTQGRARKPGRRIRIPTGELASKEMVLRVTSQDDLIAATHKALHTLATDLEAECLPAPTVHAVLAGEDHIEVLLDRPSKPPRSWTVSGDGFRWRIDRGSVRPVAFGREPLPAIVPIGRVPSSTTEVLINLEAAGVVGVRGQGERAADLIVSVALSLAGVPWATPADVILVGFGEELARTGVHLRFAASLDAILNEIEVAPAGRDNGDKHRGQLSLDGNCADGWLPTVILSTAPSDRHALIRLRSLCSMRRGVCAMVANPDEESNWMLDVDTDPAFVPQLRLALQPTPAPPEEVKAVTQIVNMALDLEGVTVDDPPYADLECSARPPGASVVPNEQADLVTIPRPPLATPPPVRINVLGIVEFEGVGDFRRPRSHEATIYIAMHPSGVSESQLDEMIWPSRPDVPASTRDPVISAVRSALGGIERFPHAHGQGQEKIYRLSNLVGTDWTAFCDLYRLGRQTSSVQPLHAALEIVRGRPFGDLDAGPGYQWLHTEGHVRHMQAEIADCADLAAGMYLEASQPVDARWTATRGLLADPYAERLWVRLMAAANALGESHEVEQLLAEMDARMGLDGDLEMLHPDTAAAYRKYSRRGYSAT